MGIKEAVGLSVIEIGGVALGEGEGEMLGGEWSLDLLLAISMVDRADSSSATASSAIRFFVRALQYIA